MASRRAQTEEAIETPTPAYRNRTREATMSPREPNVRRPTTKKLKTPINIVATSSPKRDDRNGQPAPCTRRKF